MWNSSKPRQQVSAVPYDARLKQLEHDILMYYVRHYTTNNFDWEFLPEYVHQASRNASADDLQFIDNVNSLMYHLNFCYNEK